MVCGGKRWTDKRSLLYQSTFYPIRIDHTNNRIGEGNNFTDLLYEAAIISPISDLMDWMLTHQLSSKNLSPGEKLAMMDEFKEEVKLENEKKKLATLKQNQTSNRSLQLEASDENNRDRSLNTDRQTAQKAGVGTVVRYDTVIIVKSNKFNAMFLFVLTIKLHCIAPCVFYFKITHLALKHLNFC